MADHLELVQDAFCERYKLSKEQIAQSGLSWEDLEEIYRHHAARSAQLQKTADYVMGRLREVDVVHSVKVRVKHPEHLLEKIVRKRLAGELKDATRDTYTAHVTDLIGLRALHLFKGDWLPIHEFVTANWALHEQPIAYVRQGDSEVIRKAFEEAGCCVTEHKFGYRSLHYLLKSQPALETHVAELQVRTLFEEAWSEIDHRVRYPRLSDNVYLADFLNLFNRIAGSADEMGTFIQALAQYVTRQDAQRVETERLLKDTISKLQVTEEEKKRLADQVDDLRKSTVGPIASTAFSLATKDFPSMSTVFGTAFPSTTAFATTSIGSTKHCSKCGQAFTEQPFSLIASDKCPTCQWSSLLGR